MTYVQQTLYASTGISTLLAAAYESRAFTLAKLYMPVASFAGDTSQTLTDGTINPDIDPTTLPNSSTAILADQSNVNAAGQSGHTHGTAKPLVIKISGRNLWDAEIGGSLTMAPYRIYTADGVDVTADGSNVNGKYRINRANGEIYAYDTSGTPYQISDGKGGWITGLSGPNAVVGLMEFKPLEGAALNFTQQSASEYGGVISSLSAILSAQKTLNKSLLNVIR